jgi:hypothetical protein
MNDLGSRTAAASPEKKTPGISPPNLAIHQTVEVVPVLVSYRVKRSRRITSTRPKMESDIPKRDLHPMSDLRKLKTLRDGDIDSLRACGINTIEDLWLRISEEQDNELAKLANESGIDKKRLIDLLAAEGQRRPGRLGSAWLKQHWLDLLVLGVVLALALAVWRRLPV